MTQTGLARFEGNSWDLASSIGLTGPFRCALFTQYGLQPIERDEAPLGEVVNLSAELTEQK